MSSFKMTFYFSLSVPDDQSVNLYSADFEISEMVYDSVASVFFSNTTEKSVKKSMMSFLTSVTHYHTYAHTHDCHPVEGECMIINTKRDRERLGFC